MKKLFLIILLFPALLSAQNLVPNPFFEITDTIHCGIYVNPLFADTFHDWFVPTGGTPDVFSSDIDSTCWNRQLSNQYPGPIGLKGPCPPRSGHTFCGFFAYTIPEMNQREYLSIELSEPMVAGNTYCVEFYLSLADNTEKSVDKIGAYFSIGAVTQGSDQPLPYTPQVETTTFVSDTSSWTLVSGVVTATANWDYLTIGNFQNDANTNTMLNPGSSGSPGSYGAYYFIDDVMVKGCVATNQNKPQNVHAPSIFPNPATDRITVRLNKQGAAGITIYDVTGKTLISTSITGERDLDIAMLPAGLYLYSIRFASGESYQGKIQKD